METAYPSKRDEEKLLEETLLALGLVSRSLAQVGSGRMDTEQLLGTQQIIDWAIEKLQLLDRLRFA